MRNFCLISTLSLISFLAVPGLSRGGYPDELICDPSQVILEQGYVNMLDSKFFENQPTVFSGSFSNALGIRDYPVLILDCNENNWPRLLRTFGHANEVNTSLLNWMRLLAERALDLNSYLIVRPSKWLNTITNSPKISRQNKAYAFLTALCLANDVSQDKSRNTCPRFLAVPQVQIKIEKLKTFAVGRRISFYRQNPRNAFAFIYTRAPERQMDPIITELEDFYSGEAKNIKIDLQAYSQLLTFDELDIANANWVETEAQRQWLRSAFMQENN